MTPERCEEWIASEERILDTVGPMSNVANTCRERIAMARLAALALRAAIESDALQRGQVTTNWAVAQDALHEYAMEVMRG